MAGPLRCCYRAAFERALSRPSSARLHLALPPRPRSRALSTTPLRTAGAATRFFEEYGDDGSGLDNGWDSVGSSSPSSSNNGLDNGWDSVGSSSSSSDNGPDNGPDSAGTGPGEFSKEGRTRLVPASASYFTGNTDFYDNWLALQDLLRRCQTLPAVAPSEAPRVRWKTLAQYRGVVGMSVKAAKYQHIVGILNRLNCIHPAVLPAAVRDVMELYKRDERRVASQQKPKVLDELGRAYAVGRRKTSAAKVWVIEGDGQVLVNGRPIAEVFGRMHDRESALWPLLVTQRMDKYSVWATVEGGGTTGQAEAITLGVARALLVHEPALKPALRRAGCVTRDPRMVERKKPGHVKARKMPTWVKR